MFMAVAGAHPGYVVIESHGRLILQQWLSYTVAGTQSRPSLYIFVVQNVGVERAVFRNTFFREVRVYLLPDLTSMGKMLCQLVVSFGNLESLSPYGHPARWLSSYYVKVESVSRCSKHLCYNIFNEHSLVLLPTCRTSVFVEVFTHNAAFIKKARLINRPVSAI